MRFFPALICLSALGVAALCGITYVAAHPPRLGLDVGPGSCWGAPEDEALFLSCAQEAAERSLEQPVIVRLADDTQAVAAVELGYQLDSERLQARVLEVLREEASRAGNWAARTEHLLADLPRERSIEIPVRFEAKSAAATLKQLAPRVYQEPEDARLLIKEHKIIHAIYGQELAVAPTLARLSTLDFRPNLVVDAVVDQVAPDVVDEDLAPVDITQVLASYSTSFRGKAGPRGRNIRVAASYLNGAIIKPGEVLSFNQKVGRRVHGRGFVDAPVIVNDELEQDVGGGVCQVATTLHAAAVFGNFEIVRRRSHSRPSGYAPIGLDATVIDGQVDFRIRNPYDVPVLVHAFFPDTYTIKVELLGLPPSAEVKHSVVVESEESFARRVYFREEAPAGSFELKQKGSKGMEVVSVLRITDAEGKRSTRRYRSRYYPVPEVYWVGKGAGLHVLPEASSELTGLVVEGEEVPLPGQEPASAAALDAAPSTDPVSDPEGLLN